MVRAVVDHGLSKAAAARQFNTTPKTVAKWVARFKAEGVAGLRDRSSRPLSSPSQTPARHSRCRRGFAPPAPHPGAHRQPARHLQSHRLAHPRAPRPQPALAPSSRSSQDRATSASKPGEIIHLDIKKLGRFDSSRPSHHRPSHRPSQQPRRRLGVRSRRHRRSLPRRPRRHLPRREEGKRRRLPLREPSPTSTASASPSSAS